KAAGFEKNGEAPSATPSRDDAGMALIKQMFQKALDLNTDLNADTDTDADTDADIDADAHFFFDLGGDSLSYFTLIRELDAILNVQINLEKKNNLYTVADIYKYLTEMGYF
ncbi:MAG: acyl carrier protein, partial [Oscillospiraceae bacterium]|nr:acyl carrier protein [Oscillospiraceae bacterium]